MDTENLSTNQWLTLWRVAIAGGSIWLKDFKTKPGKPERKALADLGYLSAALEHSDESNRAAMKLHLTPKGWAAVQNLAPVPAPRATRSSEVLESLIAILQERFPGMGIDLARFLQGDPAEPGPEKASVATGIRKEEDRRRIETRGPERIRRREMEAGRVPAPLAEAAVMRACAELSTRKQPHVSLRELRRAVDMLEADTTAALKRLIDREDLLLNPQDAEIGDPSPEEGVWLIIPRR